MNPKESLEHRSFLPKTPEELNLYKFMCNEVGTVELVAFQDSFDLLKAKHDLKKYLKDFFQNSTGLDFNTLISDSNVKMTEDEIVLLKRTISESKAKVKGYREAYFTSEQIMTKVMQGFFETTTGKDIEEKKDNATQDLIGQVEAISLSFLNSK